MYCTVRVLDTTCTICLVQKLKISRPEFHLSFAYGKFFLWVTCIFPITMCAKLLPLLMAFADITRICVETLSDTNVVDNVAVSAGSSRFPPSLLR